MSFIYDIEGKTEKQKKSDLTLNLVALLVYFSRYVLSFCVVYSIEMLPIAWNLLPSTTGNPCMQHVLVNTVQAQRAAEEEKQALLQL